MAHPHSPRIGVLALQGAFREHVEALHRCGASPVEIRTAQHLQGLHGLVLPGGESTVMAKLLVEEGLMEPLRAICCSGIRVMATCAGMILLASELPGHEDQPRLGLMDISVRRNAFGRQVDSFVSTLYVKGIDQTGNEAKDCSEPVEAVFIRAPLVERAGPDVAILATVNGAPVAVQQGNWLALSFHPELTADLRFHRWVSNVE
ncbi:MAG TPA: pyridoxal 5'-phosphate synthase glutaminase subunit PdxT [Candidatus Avidesulfovibrio excrementigallinarum]|nr:pyridoxal 5'-phosphate synthase glutaminase subunit PdxT [Candidatus Avidesulfovibrio excrementigallinarum]